MNVQYSNSKFASGTGAFVTKNGIEYPVTKVSAMPGTGSYAWIVKIGDGDEADQALLGTDGHLNTGETVFMKSAAPQPVSLTRYMNVYRAGSKFKPGTVFHDTQAAAVAKGAQADSEYICTVPVTFTSTNAPAAE